MPTVMSSIERAGKPRAVGVVRGDGPRGSRADPPIPSSRARAGARSGSASTMAAGASNPKGAGLPMSSRRMDSPLRSSSAARAATGPRRSYSTPSSREERPIRYSAPAIPPALTPPPPSHGHRRWPWRGPSTRRCVSASSRSCTVRRRCESLVEPSGSSANSAPERASQPRSARRRAARRYRPGHRPRR